MWFIGHSFSDVNIKNQKKSIFFHIFFKSLISVQKKLLKDSGILRDTSVSVFLTYLRYIIEHI